MANYTLQLKRNLNPIESKEAAVKALQDQLKAAKPGEPIIVVYGKDKVSILLGIAGRTPSSEYQIFEGATIKDDGQIEIPAEVKDAIDKELNDLKGESGYDNFDDIKDAIEDLLGDADEGYQSFEEIQEKIEGMSATMPDGNVVTKVTQTDGKVSVEAKTLASADKTIVVSDELDLKVNIDGETIVKGEDGKLSVASKALTVEGEDAIEVEDGATGKTIKLNIASTDKVLSQSESGLLANLELKYTKKTDAANGKIELIGKNNVVISTFDTADFTVDGFLDSVAWKGDDSNILVFTWNTNAGKTATEIDLTKYIDTYLAGSGLTLDNATKTFSVKIKEGDKYLAVDENGVASKGIDEAITAAINELDATKVSTGGTHVTVTVNEADGVITDVAVAESDIASAATLGNIIEALGLKNDGTLGEDTEGESLVGRIEALEEKVGDGGVENQINNAIGELDYEDEGYANTKYVSKVTQENGVIEVTHVNLLADAKEEGEGTDKVSVPNALELIGGSIYLSTTLDCGTY